MGRASARSCDPGRPDWYAMALFNELYFLVDGGTFWEAGEVGGPQPAADDVGRFALLDEEPQSPVVGTRKQD